MTDKDVSENVGPHLRSLSRNADNATDGTSSVRSLSHERGASPSFRDRFVDLQKELQEQPANDEDEHTQYIRALESCLMDPVERPDPPNEPTECNNQGNITFPVSTSESMHSILLGTHGKNARLRVALHKLRDGTVGQHRLIRLHHTTTGVQLEYSISQGSLLNSPFVETYAGKQRMAHHRNRQVGNRTDVLSAAKFCLSCVVLIMGSLSLSAAAFCYLK